MGLSDPEDLIPGIIAVICVIGLIGAFSVYFPVIADVPVLGVVSTTINSGFSMLANLLSPYINLDLNLMSIILELLIFIITVIVIVKIGY